MVITLSFYKCHFRIWRFKPLIFVTLSFVFGSFSSWKVFHQNVDLDWGKWINFSIDFFSVFYSAFLGCCFFHFVFLGFIFCISLFSTLNAKLEALTFPLSGTGGISLLGSQECAPEQKMFTTQNLWIYYSIAILQEKMQKWANSLVGLKGFAADNLKIRIFLDIPSTLVTANWPRPQIGANLENNIYKLNQK